MKLSCMLIATAATAFATSAMSAGTISDNDCTISLNPATLAIPKYDDPMQVSGRSEELFILTADFATQGCSCVDPGDSGFDNPDGILLVTPAGAELTPFRFNDIDGYAQFEYWLTQADANAGGGAFTVKVFDSCGGEDVLVDEATFDIDFDFPDLSKIKALEQQVEALQGEINSIWETLELAKIKKR